jgi:hypothetical protein
VDGLNGSSMGFLLFLFFYFINRGGNQTASENRPFAETFLPRRLQKMPRLIVFARLG